MLISLPVEAEPYHSAFFVEIDKFSWLVDFLLPGVTSVTSFFIC